MIRGFAQSNPITVYDKHQGIGSLEEVVRDGQVIFVCVPTPMRKDGSCDTRIVEEVITEIDKEAAFLSSAAPEVVIRSTVPPEFLEELEERVEHIHLLFMPEFLTERTADLDFINSSRFIIGGNSFEDSRYLRHALKMRFPRTRIACMSFTEAALVKYGTNTFFTVKLSFFNELYNEVLEHGGDPDAVLAEIMQDGRIGRSHFQVPGHDGDLGWGGHCFPKDNRAYSSFAQSSKMVDAAWEVNEEFRENRDWEDQTGRAVSED
jgi:UDPglucose 6-dehydrogenase